MSTVYVVQEPVKKVDGHIKRSMNLNPAKEYGELMIVLPSGPVMLHPIPMLRELKSALRNFCEEDHLLLIGDPIAIGAAVALAAHFTGGKVSTLRWDKFSRSYDRVLLDFNK